MRFISFKPAAEHAVTTGSVARRVHPLLSKLGRDLLPRWLGGKPRQHHYRLQIRCEDRADMEQVLQMVNHTLQPAGLHHRPSAAIWCSLFIRSALLARCAGNSGQPVTPRHN